MLPTHLPEPDLFTSDDTPTLRWGIVGGGWIAGEFATALRTHTTQQLVAVGGRSPERARAFADAHGITTATTVDGVLGSPDVDVVYIATPSNSHADLAIAALAAGKHVLVEKPFATTATDARRVADAARASRLFAMEAMWSRYLPQTTVIRRLLADGVLGDVRAVAADHGQAIPADPDHRLYRPELGGGALLDLGVYPLQFESMVFGSAPAGVTAIGGMTETGVDAYSTLVLDRGAGVQSTVATTMIARTPTIASISGSDASLVVDPSFYTPTGFRLMSNGHWGESVQWDDPTGLRGFAGLSWEANALARFVGEGRTESPLHDLDETVSILATIDAALAQLAA